MEQKKEKPFHEIKRGRIRVAIWKNQTEDGDVWFNVTVSRLFKDDGKWRDSSSFRRNDLLVVAKVMDLAYDSGQPHAINELDCTGLTCLEKS